MFYAGGKRYYACVTCMLWCSDTELCPYCCPTYKTLFWYIHSTYQYVPVCTDIDFLYRSVLSTYQYVLVRTKYPVPVMHVTIPDVWVGFKLPQANVHCDGLVQELEARQPVPGNASIRTFLTGRLVASTRGGEGNFAGRDVVLCCSRSSLSTAVFPLALWKNRQSESADPWHCGLVEISSANFLGTTNFKLH